MKKLTTREITTTSLFIALVYVFTWVVKFQLPISAQGGLVHLGNVPFFIACIFYGKRVGMLSGAIGMGLFDITSGWASWAPITIICCLIMGYTMASINTERLNIVRLISSFVAVCLIKIIVYYIGESIMLKSIVAPIASIPGNILQIAVASIVVMVIIKPLKKFLKPKSRNLN